ncbi:MAG: hypothetical protein ACK5MH_07590 [Bacteroidales bacterium]
MKVDILNTVKYLIFFLFFFYFAQGVFIPSGLFLPKVALAILLIFEVVFFILLINHWKYRIVNGFVLMIILNVVYYLFSDKTVIVPASNVWMGLTRIDTWTIIKNTFFNLSFFFPIYYLAFKNKISENEVIKLFYIFFIFAVVGYFYSSKIIAIEENSDEFTNNAGFAFVSIMPFLFLIKKRSLAIILLFISIGFIMMSAKRGAILIAVIFTFYYFYQQYIKNSGKHFVKNLFILIILVLISTSLIYYFYLSSDYLQLRLEKTIEGDSSKRDVIFSYIWNNYLSPNNNIWEYLFGLGFAATIKMGGMFAHNDWLELLAMSGLLGVIIYLTFFLQIYKFYKKDFLSNRDKQIITSFLFIWLFKTLFSMGYSDINNIYLVLIIAYIVGKNAKLNINNKLKSYENCNT